MNDGKMLLIAGVVAGLALATTSVVVGTGSNGAATNARTAMEPSPEETWLVDGDGTEQPAEDALSPANSRARASDWSSDDPIPRGRHARRSSKPEISSYTEFLAISSKGGPATLEQAVRATLVAEGESTRRKVAALSALLAVEAPHADDILAEAVATVPDTFDAHSGSVPRFALQLLAERAHDVDGARAALESLAFDRTPRLETTLRALAVAGLAAHVPRAAIPRLVKLLRAEDDPCVLESGIGGLAANPEARSEAAALLTLGIQPRAHSSIDD